MIGRYPYLEWCRLGVLVVLVSLLVCGCGKLGQTVAVWYVTRQLHVYFNLDTEQKAFVKARLVQQLTDVQRHDQQGIFRFFNALKHDVQEGVTEETLQALYDDYKVIVSRIVLRVLPDVSAFLATLSEAQLDHVMQKIADDQDAEEKRRSALSPQEQAEHRDVYVVKKVKAWTGKLSAAQRQAIVTWYDEIPPFPDWWEAHQQDQLERFIGFLRTYPGSQRIQHELTQIWQARDARRSLEVRDMMAERATGWRRFFIKTNATLTAKQRSKVVAKIDQYERRLRRFFGTGDRGITRHTVPMVGGVHDL